ncbi:gastrula zinc finger protein XlCGF8.2DB-like [Dryobates pubescens]|uniref:gastrula zinc finger protein XlCGF8.2DB-like n=1 Tax=Dryobates pubescens TaxID=118200 RepID=UPI0023B93A71|nr:gastrula zinc finger protein XlCGF8.2DB-like [Dryobates pubescens]
MASQKDPDKSWKEKQHPEIKFEKPKCSPKGDEEEKEEKMEEDAVKNDDYEVEDNDDDKGDLDEWEECMEKDEVRAGPSVSPKQLNQCLECGQSFPGGSEPVKHRCPQPGSRPFVCGDCGKSCGKRFRHMAHLRQHHLTHTNEKSFTCRDCGKSFKHSSTLTIHRRIHTGEKLFPCAECGKSFTTSTRLIRHQLIHSAEKPYSCADCGKSFTQKSFSRRDTLIGHRRTHTGEKSYTCADYGKSYTQTVTLNKHRCTHTREQPAL